MFGDVPRGSLLGLCKQENEILKEANNAKNAIFSLFQNFIFQLAQAYSLLNIFIIF